MRLQGTLKVRYFATPQHAGDPAKTTCRRVALPINQTKLSLSLAPCPTSTKQAVAYGVHALVWGSRTEQYRRSAAFVYLWLCCLILSLCVFRAWYSFCLCESWSGDAHRRWDGGWESWHWRKFMLWMWRNGIGQAFVVSMCCRWIKCSINGYMRWIESVSWQERQ
jgi:hypothetical protein